jgi:GNAT superfamily N-acetyltransferase
MLDIRPAAFPQDREGLLDIWREFVASPSVSLDFQGNEAEFADLPGKYAPPGGLVLLAVSDSGIVGCVAMRRVSDAVCEMKRLYVRPAARGLGVGRRLAERLLAEARRIGYAEMRLDVLAEFEQARKLYRELGFEDADPVSCNPLPGTQFLGKAL